MTSPTTKELFRALHQKGQLKQDVYHKTLAVFNEFKKQAGLLADQYQKTAKPGKYPLLFGFRDRSLFEFELKFGSDVLIFMMHTNVFEFPRDHMVMHSSYIKEDPQRSYCGLIMVFNFLNDSFKYNRLNDLGYLIGRVFINKENHYFLEGKREIGLLYNNFSTTRINFTAIQGILRSAMLYTINFDLLTPDYNTLKEVTVAEMQDTLDRMMFRTGKRLGFRFQADKVEDQG